MVGGPFPYSEPSGTRRCRLACLLFGALKRSSEKIRSCHMVGNVPDQSELSVAIPNVAKRF